MSESELREEIAALRRQLTQLEARLDGGTVTAAAPVAEKRPSRRNLLRMAGAAALGAAGTAVATAVPASAATGGSLTLGQSNDENATATLVTTGGAATPVVMLQVQGGGAAVPGSTQQGLTHGAVVSVGSSGNDGIDGYAAGATGYGVLGQSDAGYGVVGATDTGVDLAAIGTGRLQQRAAAAGAPAYTPAAGRFEMTRDNAGGVWASNSAGAWRSLSSFNIFPNPRRIFGDFSYTPSDTTTGPIDATVQIAGAPYFGAATGVPVGAQAAWCAFMSYEMGVVTFFPDGTADTKIGTITATGNGTLLTMNYLLIPLSAAGRFRMHTYINSDPQGRGGRLFIDVWGYLI